MLCTRGWEEGPPVSILSGQFLSHRAMAVLICGITAVWFILEHPLNDTLEYEFVRSGFLHST